MPATVPPPRSLRASRRAPAWTPRLGLLVGLLAVFRARLPTCHAATANPMDHDDPADTIASFSEAVMREAMWDMYDADTGAALDNSKAISLNVDAENTDEVDLALFVDDDDHPGYPFQPFAPRKKTRGDAQDPHLDRISQNVQKRIYSSP